jgi:hypothetical protein
LPPYLRQLLWPTMRARLRRAIRGCDGVRRLAPAPAVGVGGRRGCRCGTAGQRGSRPHRAAPRRHFLTDARNSAISRLAHTSSGVCASVVALAPKPMRTGRQLTSDAPVAPCRCTRPGPAPCRCTGDGAARWHWAASGRPRRRWHGAAVEPGHWPPRRRAAWAIAGGARSRAAGPVFAGRGADRVMRVSLPHCCAPLTGNTRPGRCRPDDGAASSRVRNRDVPGSALLTSLPGPLMRRRSCFRQCPRGTLVAARGCLASAPAPVITPPGRRRERPLPSCTARPWCAAVQDAVNPGQRADNGQELISRRAGHSGPGGLADGVSRRSAADFRLRFAGGVVVPFLQCR